MMGFGRMRVKSASYASLNEGRKRTDKVHPIPILNDCAEVSLSLSMSVFFRSKDVGYSLAADRESSLRRGRRLT